MTPLRKTNKLFIAIMTIATITLGACTQVQTPNWVELPIQNEGISVQLD